MDMRKGDRLAVMLYNCVGFVETSYACAKIGVVVACMDQRRANILSREIGKKLNKWKPVAVHHYILPNLRSRGRMAARTDIVPENNSDVIFIHDKPQVIKTKDKKAICPERDMRAHHQIVS